MKLGIILNPNSRYNLRNPESADEYQQLGGSFVELRKTSSPDDVTCVAEDFLKRGISFIGISGGDGTIHQTLTRLIHVYGKKTIPPVLLLGDGTMNNIAHSIGIRNKGRANLKKFLQMVQRRELVLRERTTMHIDGRYCFLFGCGMTSNFLTELYKGEKGYLKSVDMVKNAIGEVFTSSLFNHEVKLLRPLDGEIYFDGEKMPLHHMLVVLAGTVEEVGFRLRPLYLASEKRGHFHVIATDLDPKDVLVRLGIISTGNGKLIRNPRYCDRLVREIVIRSPGPFEYTMDGDIYIADGELEVKTGPDIQFVVV